MILYNTFLTIGPEPKKANINLFNDRFCDKDDKQDSGNWPHVDHG